MFSLVITFQDKLFTGLDKTGADFSTLEGVAWMRE
jgi:hypothetical protein